MSTDQAIGCSNRLGTAQITVQPHPRGSKARVLLSAVFGPYAQDDKFGSRAINPMELYHNQVTRVQGIFSPRRFHHTWGIRLIRSELERVFGPVTSVSTRLFAPLLRWTSRLEEKRLLRGITYEPRSFIIRRNWA